MTQCSAWRAIMHHCAAVADCGLLHLLQTGLSDRTRDRAKNQSCHLYPPSLALRVREALHSQLNSPEKSYTKTAVSYKHTGLMVKLCFLLKKIRFPYCKDAAGIQLEYLLGCVLRNPHQSKSKKSAKGQKEGSSPTPTSSWQQDAGQSTPIFGSFKQ